MFCVMVRESRIHFTAEQGEISTELGFGLDLKVENESMVAKRGCAEFNPGLSSMVLLRT